MIICTSTKKFLTKNVWLNDDFVAGEMESRFHNMEILLSNQLQIIKEMITNMEDKLGDQEEKILRGQKQLSNLVSKNFGNGFMQSPLR